MTKPISDTPRTDGWEYEQERNLAWQDNCRTLERELNSANQQIENQASIIRDSCTPINEREARLLGELTQLRQERDNLASLVYGAKPAVELFRIQSQGQKMWQDKWLNDCRDALCAINQTKG